MLGMSTNMARSQKRVCWTSQGGASVLVASWQKSKNEVSMVLTAMLEA